MRLNDTALASAVELSTILCEASRCLEKGYGFKDLCTCNKEKALVEAFSGHCETPGRFVDSSILLPPLIFPTVTPLCLASRGGREMINLLS